MAHWVRMCVWAKGWRPTMKPLAKLGRLKQLIALGGLKICMVAR